MSTVPLIPDSAPFTTEQRAWLNGFLAGIFNRSGAPSGAGAVSPAASLKPLTVLFGTQTGTAETLAKQAAKEAGKRGFAPTVLDMAAVSVEQLPNHANLLVITSTYGDGEPPEDAVHFWEAVVRGNGLDLRGIRYSVLALGNTTYDRFCQCGRDFDAALERHGAMRIYPRVDCDVDYDLPAKHWLDGVRVHLAAADRSGLTA